MQLFLSITLWLLIGTATAYLANHRGRDPWIWFMIGMLLGLLGLLLLYLLPPASNEKSPTPAEEGEFALVEAEPEPPAELSPLELWYYYDRLQERQGPVLIENLKTLFKQGEINEETYLWCEGMPDWKKLTALTDLHEKLRT